MKERESNFEAARILAMILVVLVHANYFSLGGIDRSDIITLPSSSFMRIFLEQLCIVGVNLFILISGWFGVRGKTGQGENPVFRITKKYVPLNR